MRRGGFLGKKHRARRGGGCGDAGWGPLWSPALGVSSPVLPPPYGHIAFLKILTLESGGACTAQGWGLEHFS
jgi:hypothetical protein